MAGIERRDRHNPRVQLGGLPVELIEDDLPGGFEADAHDLGVGGVGVRAAFLPKIGSRLHLRLVSPTDGAPIEASGEVVWRDDAGPHEGAFGLRFDAMDGASAEELARLIEAQLGTPGAPAIEAVRVEEPPYALEDSPHHEPHDEPQDAHSPEHVELHLDGVGDSLEALLVHDGGDLVTLEQSLDFLTLGRGAALGDGRRGEIAAIELRSEAGLPRLVITLSFEELARSDDAPARSFDEFARSDDKLAQVRHEDADEDEFVEASHIFAKEIRTSSAGELEAVVEPLFDPLGAHGFAEPELSEASSFEASSTVAPLLDERSSAYDAPSAEPLRDELAEDATEAAFFEQAPYQGTWVERPGDRVEEQGGGALVELRRFALRAKLSAAENYQRAKPHLERFATKARARSTRLFGTTLSAVMGFLRAIFLRSQHFVKAFVRRLLDRPALEAPAAPSRPRRQQQGAPEIPIESRKKSRSQLVIGLGLLLAIVAAIGWMVSGSEDAGEATAAALQAPADPASEERSAGAPATGGFVDSSVAYGADAIADAMIFELTLEGEPLTIRGETEGDAVRVHVPEARALSRAGVIAANHPDIEYASIRNLEDGAELELRFVPGREPAYRVELRGLVLRVSLSP